MCLKSLLWDSWTWNKMSRSAEESPWIVWQMGGLTLGLRKLWGILFLFNCSDFPVIYPSFYWEVATQTMETLYSMSVSFKNYFVHDVRWACMYVCADKHRWAHSLAWPWMLLVLDVAFHLVWDVVSFPFTTVYTRLSGLWASKSCHRRVRIADTCWHTRLYLSLEDFSSTSHDRMANAWPAEGFPGPSVSF